MSCLGQEIELDQVQFDSLAKLGIVTRSAKLEIELTFPDGFMDEALHGRIALVNDGDTDAEVSNVTTSCGCTSAIPAEKVVHPGKSSILLMNYNPKAVATNRVEAHFTFGGKEFHLAGNALTKPRFLQSTASLTFEESGKVEVKLHKQVATEVESFVVFPTDLKAENFQDTDDFVSVTIGRDPKRLHPELLISPKFGDKQFKQMRFELRYKGEIEVLPRRLIAIQKSLRFFLRGDVESLAGTDKLQITIDGQTQTVECQTSLVGTLLSVEFENVFTPGEYKTTMQLKDVSFSLPVSVR